MKEHRNRRRQRERKRQQQNSLQLQNHSKKILAFLAAGLSILYLSSNNSRVLEASKNISSNIFSGLFKIPKTIFAFSSLQLGKTFAGFNQDELGMYFLSFAIETDSFDFIKAKAHERRGLLHLDKGNLNDAAEDLKTFSRLNSNYHYAYNVNIEKLHEEQKKDLEKDSSASAIDKDNFLAYNSLDEELNNLIKTLRSEDYKASAMEAKKRTAKQHEAAMYEAAIRDLTVIIAIDNTISDLDKRSELYEKTGKYAECIADLKEIIRLIPHQDVNREKKANLYKKYYERKIALEIKTNRVDAAIESYSHLVGIFPDEKVAYYKEQAALFLKANHINKAVNRYKKIGEINLYSLVPPDFRSLSLPEKERSIKNKYIPIENEEVKAPLYAQLAKIALTSRSENIDLSLEFFERAMLSFSNLGKLDEIKNYLPPLSAKSNAGKYAQKFYNLTLNFLMEKNAYGEIFSILDKIFSHSGPLKSDEYHEDEDSIISFKGMQAFLDNLRMRERFLSQTMLDKLSAFQSKNAESKFQREKNKMEERIGQYLHNIHNIDLSVNSYASSDISKEIERSRRKIIKKACEDSVKTIIPLAETAKSYKDVVGYCNFVLYYEDQPREAAKYTLTKLGALIKMEQYNEVIKIAGDFIGKCKESDYTNDKSWIKSSLAKIYHLRGLAKENLSKKAGEKRETPWADYSEARRLAPEIKWLDKAVYYLGDIARQRIESLPHYYGEQVNGRFSLHRGVDKLSGSSSAFFKSEKYLDSGAFNNATHDYCPAPEIAPR